MITKVTKKTDKRYKARYIFLSVISYNYKRAVERKEKYRKLDIFLIWCLVMITKVTYPSERHGVQHPEANGAVRTGGGENFVHRRELHRPHAALVSLQRALQSQVVAAPYLVTLKVLISCFGVNLKY